MKVLWFHNICFFGLKVKTQLHVARIFYDTMVWTHLTNGAVKVEKPSDLFHSHVTVHFDCSFLSIPGFYWQVKTKDSYHPTGSTLFDIGYSVYNISSPFYLKNCIWICYYHSFFIFNDKVTSISLGSLGNCRCRESFQRFPYGQFKGSPWHISEVRTTHTGKTNYFNVFSHYIHHPEPWR